MEAIQFINTTPEQLKDLIFSAVEVFVKPKPEEELLTQSEVAQFYKVTTKTIQKWQDEGKINCYFIGDTRRYKKSELLESLVKLK